MKQAFLESSIKLSQLQARLSKGPYLSQQSLPSRSDARAFFLIEKSQKTPDRCTHPHLYHWYIIMKQFATRTLMAWLEADNSRQDQDQLIQALSFEINPQPNQQQSPNLSKTTTNLQTEVGKNKNSQRIIDTPKNSQKRRIHQNYVESNENCSSSLKEMGVKRQRQVGSSCRERTPLHPVSQKNELYSPIIELQSIMEMQFNIDKYFSPQLIKERLAKENIEILSFEVEDQVNLRVYYKIDMTEYQGLKDRISKWSEVSNIRFRKEKKMTSKTEIKNQNTHSPIKRIHNA